jgi:hypothetical protein
MMSPTQLAFLILKRMYVYAIFVIAGMSFLIYVAYSFIDYANHVKTHRQMLDRIDADVIAPKGSSIDHLRRILRLEVLADPVLIPSQLYQTLKTNPPPGLELAPVLFWGKFHDVPVIAASELMQPLLNAEFPEIKTLAPDEAILGKGIAQRFNLHSGDVIQIESSFGTLAKSVIRPFKVKSSTNLGAWDQAILTSLATSPALLEKTEFLPEQIWKNQVLSYVFATGPERYLAELKQLIDKRTVAVDLRLRNEIPALLKLSGIDEKLEIEVLLFALLSSVISLAAFLAIWIPLLTKISSKLKRSGYNHTQLVTTFTLLTIFLLSLAVLLAALASVLRPII